MRVPVPKPPEFTAARIAWAALLGAVLGCGVLYGAANYPPLAFGILGALLVAEVWLIGGEMLNKYLDSRD